MKFPEPREWILPVGESFYTKFKNANELYTMTKPDWDIVQKHLTQFRTCLDVGGHVGTTALRYANNFEKVHVFEPLYYEICKRNLSHVDTITIHPFGASDKTESLTMVKRRGNSGLTTIITDSNKSFLTRGDYEKIPKQINTIPIDTFSFSDVDFIKLDTEGFVLPVLKGMIQTLEQNHWPLLQIEFNKLCSNIEECFSYLKDLGYEHFDTFHVDHFFRKL